jgi:hypothetical protein
MKIRDFEYPQTLCSFEPFRKSNRFIHRTLKNFFPEDLIVILETCHQYFEKPVTIKLQMAMYVTGNNSTTDRDKLLETMKNRKVIGPCCISTVSRFILSNNIFELPASITNSDYVIAICESYTLRINLLMNTVEIADPGMIINPETYIMMETDSI